MKDDYSKVEISKTDITTGEELKGAKLQILNKEGEILEEWVTDGKPHLVEKLPVGEELTLREITAPEGYEIDESEYAFEIKEDGQIVKATMTNEKIPEELITTPKTGDDSRPGLWIGLSALSGAGVAVFGILTAVKMRKRKGEDKA